MMSLDAQKMRQENRRLFLKLIWERSELSRAEISRITGMSRSTVSEIVAELIKFRFVYEKGAGNSCGGRRPIILKFNEDSYFMAGLEIGASHLEIALINLKGRLLAQQTINIDIDDKPNETLESAYQAIHALIATHNLNQSQFLGLGIALASPVNPKDEVIKMSPEIRPAWQNYDIHHFFRSRFQTAVFIENDANMGALAEAWWGEHADKESLVFIKLGTGFGAGLVMNGQVFSGALGLAGEIGHMVIDYNSTLSLRGIKGCLAAYAGSAAILERTRQELQNFPSSSLNQEKLTIDAIVQANQAGDSLAGKIVEEMGRYIGLAVVNVINLLNPGAIILGGKFAEAGPKLFTSISKEISSRVLWPALAKTPVSPSRLTSQSVAIGAATQVLKQLLHGNLLDFQSQQYVSEHSLDMQPPASRQVSLRKLQQNERHLQP